VRYNREERIEENIMTIGNGEEGKGGGDDEV
jgi:hypothetical protein